MSDHQFASTRRGFLAGAGLSLGAASSRAPADSRANTLSTSALIPPGDLLIDPDIVHLQTGTLGLTPRPVFEATVAAARTLERDPLIGAYGPGKERLDGVRRQAAGLLGCAMGEIVLTSCTTSGMTMTAQGLRLSPGDHVLTTDQEHHGGSLCWTWLGRRQGVAIDTVAIPPGETDGRAIVERFAKAITPATKVISLSHILYSTGLRMPVAQICVLGREHGCVTVVDGAQAVGAIPVDVKALGCHVYAASGHKWLLGPEGTGLLYISAELGNSVDAMALQSGRQVNSDAAGVANIAGLYGLAAAINYLLTIGLSNVEQHNLAICRELRALLSDLPRVRIDSPPDGPLASQLVTFSVANADAKALRERLSDRYRVHVRAVDQNGYAGLRASPHLYNTSAHVRALVQALKEELG